MDNASITIGNLFGECNIVNQQELNRAGKISQLSGLPIGKCLVLLDCITDEELRAFLEAQSLIREGIFARELITEALEIVVRQKWQLADALLSLGCDAHVTRRTRLGELLEDAEAINPEHLSYALKAADLSCIPLGKVLTSFNSFDSALIEQALELQTGIRRGDLDRSPTVRKLGEFVKREGLQQQTPGSHFMLGELLCNAGTLSKTKLEEALKQSASRNQLIGMYLVESDTVSESLLLAALCLQNLLDAKLINMPTACDLLNDVGSTMPNSVTRSDSLSLFDFLRAGGYLTVEKRKLLMQKMAPNGQTSLAEVKEKLSDTSIFSGILMKEFPKDSAIINAGMVMHKLALAKKLSATQAILAFCFRQNGIKIGAYS